MILRNDIQDLPQDTDVAEKDVFYQDNLIREIYIRKKGKGNALNVGICYARNALVCVIDADCILQEDALSKAVKHFQNDEVVAVGGRLLVKREDSSQLEAIQFCEYMKTFQLSRRIFARLNAQCLISGAFGVFRKSTLLGINGYDIDTVGEDMELVLRLQEQDLLDSYVERFNKRDRQRYAVRPGLECPPYQHLDHAMTWNEKLDNDVWYVQNCSLKVDIVLIFRIIQLAFNRKATAVRSKAGAGGFLGYNRDGSVITTQNVPVKYCELFCEKFEYNAIEDAFQDQKNSKQTEKLKVGV